MGAYFRYGATQPSNSLDDSVEIPKRCSL